MIGKSVAAVPRILAAMLGILASATWLRCAAPPAPPLTIDDFEDGDLVSSLGTSWIDVTDVSSHGDSTVEVKVVEEGAADTRRSLSLRGTMGSAFAYPFAGAFVALVGAVEGSGSRSELDAKISAAGSLDDVYRPRDLRGYEGIQFYAKGDGGWYSLKLATTGVPGFDYPLFSFVAPKSWTRFRVPFSKFSPLGFASDSPSLRLDKSLGLFVMVQAPPTPGHAPYEVEVDQFSLY